MTDSTCPACDYPRTAQARRPLRVRRRRLRLRRLRHSWSGPAPRRPAPRDGRLPVSRHVVTDLRVIELPATCPECASTEVGTDQVSLGDGIDETAYICEDCGTAWPLAFICEWSLHDARR